jgi:DNA polymerase-3 subunit gamma/tau
MTRRLKEICEAEKANLSDRSLALLVAQSDGGMRDALSLLDQVLSACGSAPTDEAVAEALGAIDRTVVHALAQSLVRRDARTLLAAIEDVFNKGIDLGRLAEELAQYLRHLFVARSLGEAPSELAESEQRSVVALSKEADPAQLARLFDVVYGSAREVSRSEQPRLALEMSLLKAVQLAPAASIPELIARVEKLGASGGRSTPAPFRSQGS